MDEMGPGRILDLPMPYPKFQKVARWNRDIIITEKIDGTNGLIYVDQATGTVRAGSRNRWLSPASDNFGFAFWVKNNAVFLALLLGPGYHYGEWWGSGIQRGYGLKNGERRFSLFNVTRHKDTDFSSVPGLGVVPILDEGLMCEHCIHGVLDELEESGSMAVPRFNRPEGIVIFHTASNQLYKITLENDEVPKSKVA